VAKKRSAKDDRPLFDLALGLLASGVKPDEIRRRLRELGYTALQARQDVNLARETLKIKALLGR
jgi:hypothetical protein